MKAPDLSAEWYRVITQFADGTPVWVHTVAGTDAGLLLFAALFVAAWWRARRGDAHGMSLALASGISATAPAVPPVPLEPASEEARV
jgi:undecaprenyl-diphosphatase